MADPALAFVAYEPLADSVWPWAALARALGRAGRNPLYVGPPRRPTAAELARVAAARGAWAPTVAPTTTDGVSVVHPLDLPARRVAALSDWDRASLETALARHGDPGWVVVFSSALGKPWPRPPGWRLCWFPIDEFAAGDPRFAAREDEILAECDLLVSVSEAVVASRRSRVRRAAVLANGYDRAAFSQTAPPDAEVAALPGPRIGYVGTVSPSKFDVDLVARLAEQRPGVAFVLVGPTPDPSTTAVLDDLPNVHRLAPRPPASVPSVLSALDGVLLPYRDTPMNRACSPLKAREALAAGLPVISSPVEELRAHAGAALVCDDAEAFVAALDRVVHDGWRPDSDAARFFVDGTWDVRASEFAALLEASDETGAP